MRICPKCGLNNPPGTVACNCGYDFKRSVSLVAAGYVCAVLALGFFPPGFGLAAVVIGIVNVTKSKEGHGIAQIVLGVTCGFVGWNIGANIAATGHPW
jgi:uncharacterized OB-fold protein